MLKHVTIEDIFDEGRLDLVEHWDLEAHTAFVCKVVKNKALYEELTSKQMQNFVNYWGVVPNELMAELYRWLGLAKTLHNIETWHRSEIQQDKLPGKFKGKGTYPVKNCIVDAHNSDPNMNERWEGAAERIKNEIQKETP